MSGRRKQLRGKAKRLRDHRIFNEAYPKDGSPGVPRHILAKKHRLSASGLYRAIQSAARDIRKKNARLYLAQTKQLETVSPPEEVTSEGLVDLLETLLTAR